MKSKKLLTYLTLAIFLFIFLDIMHYSFSKTAFGQEAEKETLEITTTQNDLEKEGLFKYYFVPFMPILSIFITVLGGAYLSYYYWKKREGFTRRRVKIEEKMKSFLSLSSAFVKFNAYTDLLMRLQNEKRKFLNPPNPEALSTFFQIDSNYQVKRIEALSEMTSNINYSQIFFSSDLVVKRIRTYLDYYDRLRQDEKKWDKDKFSNIISNSRKILDSMKGELKREIS